MSWGEKWRTPTSGEISEILTVCKWEWCCLQGVNGYKVIGPNGNSLFLPASGAFYDGRLRDRGTDGFYWSSTPDESFGLGAANDLSFCSELHTYGRTARENGSTIRPVTK